MCEWSPLSRSSLRLPAIPCDAVVPPAPALGPGSRGRREKIGPVLDERLELGNAVDRRVRDLAVADVLKPAAGEWRLVRDGDEGCTLERLPAEGEIGVFHVVPCSEQNSAHPNRNTLPVQARNLLLDMSIWPGNTLRSYRRNAHA